ncbi:hypothetical protein ZIOFF_042927 [Zingiber officinale]|uniref:Pentatricopeptide repeat-containing protein n=1 Tax=Zingiber officinale TaxID=94328 RepID=A0A8J5FWG1_ZINOF|nr:hypothetical protein ZIOFF_042927 [Zingiber officinale]
MNDALAAKLLRLNAGRPALVWRLFRQLLSSPASSNPSIPTIASLSRLLAASRMLPELHQLRLLLLPRRPPDAAHAAVSSIVSATAASGLIEEALLHFQSLRSHFPSHSPSLRLYNTLLNCSLHLRRPDLVEVIYRDMLLARVPLDTYTFNILMSSLCDSGHLVEARQLFDKMPSKNCLPNEFTFGILVRGYCKLGLCDTALELLDVMERQGCLPNIVIYNTLISSLCKEGLVSKAENLVECMRKHDLLPNVVTFNSRISALCKAGRVLDAYQIFLDMQEDQELGLPLPNQITFNLILDGFCKAGMLEKARSLVDLMKGRGLFKSTVSYNIWLSGLVKCRRPLEAQQLLVYMVEQGVEPNLYTYNIIIDGLCKEGMIIGARSVMSLMRKNGLSPDTVTYSSLLQWYCTKRNVSGAIRILHEMASSGCFPNFFSCNILLKSLWKEGRSSEAEKLLQKMIEKSYNLDIVTCNIIINGLCKSGKLDKAVKIVNGMWQHGSAALGELGNAFLGLIDTSKHNKCCPNGITYSILINHLCKDGRLDEAKKLVIEMLGKNIAPNSLIYDTFVNAYCKQGKVSSAFKVITDMEKKRCPLSTKTYNLLIWALDRKGKLNEIDVLINEMQQQGIQKDVITYNNMIHALCDCEMVRKAASLLEEMLQNSIVPNVASFSLLIKGFCKISDFNSARDMLNEALIACGETEILYSVMCNEYCLYGKVLEAKEILQIALNKGFPLRYFQYKNLIEGLCKEDKIDDGHNLLNAMIAKGHLLDPAAFMPVIDAMENRGKKHETDKLSEKMMDMAAAHHDGSKVSLTGHMLGESNLIIQKQKKDVSSKNEWHNLLHKDDGSGIALKVDLNQAKDDGHVGLSIKLCAQKGIIKLIEVAALSRESMLISLEELNVKAFEFGTWSTL